MKKGLSQEQSLNLINSLLGLSNQPLRSTGKRNMVLGILIILGGLLVTLLTYVFAGENKYVLIFTGAIISGFILFLRGIAQYISKDQTYQEKVRFDLNKQIYGVEEPEKTWDCPNCKHINSNFTYQCQACGYKLL